MTDFAKRKLYMLGERPPTVRIACDNALNMRRGLVGSPAQRKAAADILRQARFMKREHGLDFDEGVFSTYRAWQEGCTSPDDDAMVHDLLKLAPEPIATDESRSNGPWQGQHMQPEVYRGDYFSVETTSGTEIVPVEAVGRTMTIPASALLNYLEGKPLDDDADCEVLTGWLARLQAPGYLDCTDWSVHDSEREAHAYLEETYGAQ